MFGRVLREARERAGLTQEQLAFEAHLHRTYISLMERNVKSPTLDVLLRLGKALNVTAASLVARVERNAPQRLSKRR
jgi:transcriptional regulator with XRE-family HTH domain